MKPNPSTVALGHSGQDQAETYLKKKGLKVICKNFRTRHGEIDLICKDKRTLVFVEVKTRRNHLKGSALEAVHWHKQQQLSLMAKLYLQKHFKKHPRARFDVVGIERDQITWIRDAFEVVEV